MKIENIKVSVIIPTFKRSEFLSRAIDSLLHQTHKNIEIIIVDDNHPNSEYVSKTFESLQIYFNDERVIYRKNDRNLGCALARNEGIKIATGDYVTFLDDDDLYLPEKIEKQLIYMINNNFDMSFTPLSLYNEENKLIDYREYTDIKSFKCVDLKKYHIMRHLTGTDTFMYKRDYILSMGGFGGDDIGDEFYLMYKTICNNARIGYMDENYVIAYVHKREGVSKGSGKIAEKISCMNLKKVILIYFLYAKECL
ncbi:glycosyltransferase family 2 protein [Bacillus mobilis]|uniref:glycosyltransferase family 2 protein n=1 Tax=Bacillus mobilis TaxID=2026190 RepID=UPI002FDC5122